MMPSKKKAKNLSCQVKHDPEVLAMVRERKEKTGQEIGKFYDIAAVEKIDREKAIEEKMKSMKI